METLAVKYRPKTWEDVTEQSSAVAILQQQLATGSVKNAYLFCGPAGCGKTTCARIFADAINNGEGNAIEMDAASNSGVDDVRNIAQQAKAQSLSSEYKVFIIDECHSISSTGWQAFLKLIEEPPAKSIFIFCTTDPQKIPKTILSRVQRYDFRRISNNGIFDRLNDIMNAENNPEDGFGLHYDPDALDYIVKLADGGMRDAITLLDKCLSYTRDLTLQAVVSALGTVDYDTMIDLTNSILVGDVVDVIERVEDIYSAGKDIKQFVRQFMVFMLDVVKYDSQCPVRLLSLPKLATVTDWLRSGEGNYNVHQELLSVLVNLNAQMRYSESPKYDLESALLLYIIEGR